MDLTSRDDIQADVRKQSPPELKQDPANSPKNKPAKPSQNDIKPALDWLDMYVAYSRMRSPRAYDDFHVTCGLWLLSTVAAGRISWHLGFKMYSTLYILMVARTSLYAKTTTARIALEIIYLLGLDCLLMPSNSTPSKFISIMAEEVLRVDDKENIRGFPAGRRAWYYEEFGSQLGQIVKPGGTMSGFLPELKKIDDHLPIGSATQKRGEELVDLPYLALLAVLTPADMRRHGGKGSLIWGDGFLARFGIMCPQSNAQWSKDKFPRGELPVPDNILDPLREWDKRLSKNDEELIVSDEVYNAFHDYGIKLLHRIVDNPNEDLDGNLAKLPTRAIRIAGLSASLEGCTKIKMKHWHRGEEIADRFLAGASNLYDQLSDKSEVRREKQVALEDRILKRIRKTNEAGSGASATDVHRYVKTKDIAVSDIANMLDHYNGLGLLTMVHGKRKARRYWLPEYCKQED